MSVTYIQLEMPITNIQCLDQALKELGVTWNRPSILTQIESARENLANADTTSKLIQANQELASLLEQLLISEPLDTIVFTINGVNIQLSRNHGRYTAQIRQSHQSSQIQSIMSRINSNYKDATKKLEAELTTTLMRLEEQKDILSSEQLEMERLRLKNEKFAIEASNKQRVLEVTKEVEAKLAARGFEIRKRLIGKKIVYQAVRRN